MLKLLALLIAGWFFYRFVIGLGEFIDKWLTNRNIEHAREHKRVQLQVIDYLENKNKMTKEQRRLWRMYPDDLEEEKKRIHQEKMEKEGKDIYGFEK